MSAFTVTDAATWPELLSLDQVAAIYQKNPDAVMHACKPCRGPRQFRPVPYKRRPLRWRKVDVVRDVRGKVAA